MKKEPKPFVVFSITPKIEKDSLLAKFGLNFNSLPPITAHYFEDDSLCIVNTNNCAGPIVPKGSKIVIVKEKIPLYLHTGKAAWDLFYNHATFDEILNITEGHHHVGMYAYRNCAKEPACPEYPVGLSQESDKKAFDGEVSEYYKGMLETIRDNPYLLSKIGVYYPGNRYADILARLLEIARWNTNKEEAKKAKKMLLDYLIPKKPRGIKKSVLPQPMFDMVKELARKLSKHLSEKCKDEYCLGDYSDNEFITWANTEGIYNLPSKDLGTLICKPIKFADNLVHKHFNIKSMKTAKKAKQQMEN